jgi:hypothetical protein
MQALNGNGTKALTVKDLSAELNLSTEQIKAFLVDPELKEDSVIPLKKVEQLRRTYGALSNPVSSSLVASPELDKGEIKENLQDLSKKLDAPQKMINAIAQHQFKILLESTAQQAYLRELAEAKGKKDAQDFLKAQELEQELQDLENKQTGVSSQESKIAQIKDYLTSYVPPENQAIADKLAQKYEAITQGDTEKQDFLRRVANGEPVTEQERQRFFW